MMTLAMAISGTIGLLVIESGQAPLTVVFFRCLIGGLGLGAWLTITKTWTRMRFIDVAWTVGGGLALVLNWLCLFSSYRYSSVSVATVIYHTQPFMLLVIVAIFQREGLILSRLPWLALAFGGVILTSQVQTTQEAGSTWIGAILACSAALLYAIATLVTRQLKHLPPAQIAVFQMLVGVLILLPMAITSIEPLGWKSMAALGTLGVVHTAFMYTIMYAAFQRLPTQSIAALSFIYPVVAVLVDVVYFKVSLSEWQWIGMASIMFAVIADQQKWKISALWLRAAA